MATLVLHAHPNTPAWPAPATAIAPSSPRWRGAQGPEVHGTDFALAAVALSMLSTPLLMLAYERRVAPRYTIAGTREFDAIDDPETVRRTEEHCRTHYPDRGLIARARGRIDAYADADGIHLAFAHTCRGRGKTHRVDLHAIPIGYAPAQGDGGQLGR